MAEAPSLNDYGLLADGHGAALVSRAGAVDWCCLPRVDRASFFGRLLDWPRGGHFTLTTANGGARNEQAYLEDTMVLETTIHAGRAAARVIDFLARGDERRLVRVVEGLRGEVRLRAEIVVRFDYGAVRPWVRRDGDGLFRVIGGDDGLIVASDAALELRDEHDLAGEVVVRAGERVRIALTYREPHRCDAPI